MKRKVLDQCEEEPDEIEPNAGTRWSRGPRKTFDIKGKVADNPNVRRRYLGCTRACIVA
jgi:hypothetical protein